MAEMQWCPVWPWDPVGLVIVPALESCPPCDLFVSRHPTSEILNWKWTVVDLLLQDNTYISSLVCLISLVSDAFTLVQIGNEWNSDQPFFFHLGAWRAHLYCKWKLELMLRNVIVITAEGNGSRTFYIVSMEASFYVALKATANPP